MGLNETFAGPTVPATRGYGDFANKGQWRAQCRSESFVAPKENQLVGAAGLEPATTCLEGRCSIHLSYAPNIFDGSIGAVPPNP